MSRVVLSVGGSLINPGKVDVLFLQKLAKLVNALSKEFQFAVISGGGTPAREYASAVRALGGNEFVADEAAILMTRANAFIAASALGERAYPGVMEDFNRAAEAVAVAERRVVVMGGTIPGFTTDADAALLAEKIRARRLVNLSNIDAIYDRPPRRAGAKKFSRMTHSQLVKLANEYDMRKAGTHFVFDNIACKIIARSKMETHFVNGKDLKQVEAAIRGGKHDGTTVK
ncbi:MAG: UMP kinase [Candidatus ainarchaeum sp.]|nr:UMP kinase [Candidatus ainarchaeum sp.]